MSGLGAVRACGRAGRSIAPRVADRDKERRDDARAAATRFRETQSFILNPRSSRRKARRNATDDHDPTNAKPRARESARTRANAMRFLSPPFAREVSNADPRAPRVRGRARRGSCGSGFRPACERAHGSSRDDVSRARLAGSIRPRALLGRRAGGGCDMGDWGSPLMRTAFEEEGASDESDGRGGARHADRTSLHPPTPAPSSLEPPGASVPDARARAARDSSFRKEEN